MIASTRRTCRTTCSGYKATLLEGTRRKGIDLRQELVRFYERHYSANQMLLAVVAPQSIPQLRGFVTDVFGAGPDRGASAPEDEWAFRVPPYGRVRLIQAQGSVVEIVTIQELQQVTVTWPVTFSAKEEREAFRLKKVESIARAAFCSQACLLPL